MEVPNIKETVHTRQIEHTSAGRGPATVREVGLVVASLHDGVEDTLFAPHLSLPVTNTHKVLVDEWIALECVDGPVMLAHLSTEPEVGLNLLSLVYVQDVTLLRADQELLRAGVSVVLHRCASKDLGALVSISIIELVRQLMLFGWHVGHAHVPPEDVAISGRGDALFADFARCLPVDIVHGVVVRVLERCYDLWLKDT